MTDRIHNHSMLRLSKKPTRPMEQWQRVVRPGVDGVALWGTGHRAEPVEVESVAFAATITAAMQLYTQYCWLAGLPAIEVEFASYQEPNCLYKVLSVEPVTGQVRAQLRGIHAGDATNYQGWLVCTWVLQPINEVPP